MRNGVVVAFALLQSACAAREPPPAAPAPSVHLDSLKPMTTIQPQDATASCADIEAEVKSNNLTVTEIAKQNGWQIAQSPGSDSVNVWPVWFGSGFDPSKSLAGASLQARQQRLAGLVSERCAHARSAGARP